MYLGEVRAPQHDPPHDAHEVGEREDLGEALAQRGIPSNGNMNPESRIEGRKKKKVIWNDWNCVCTAVETRRPRPSVAVTKKAPAR